MTSWLCDEELNKDNSVTAYLKRNLRRISERIG